MTDESMGFGGGWIWAFLIIALIFNGGIFGNGGNAVTTADLNAQTSALNQQQLLLSSANNNYETARLIDAQTMATVNSNNTNLINAIQGFNAVNQSLAQNFAITNSNIADLGYRMDRCCCEIKTMMLENRLQDTQSELANTQNVAVNANQSLYLLSQLGKYTPGTTAGA